MSEMKNLEPQNVWSHFETICGIPHPSRHEEELAEYIMDHASSTGNKSFRDKTGNVIVHVPASPGREDDRSLILQGHLDMVPVAAEGITHDFNTTPIEPYVDGNLVRARGTTLGADNGIGVAMMLALLDGDKPHGPLELLFTVNEEAGMTGARGVGTDYLSAKHLINLDTEEWGEIYVSCAGGADSIVTLDLQRETTPVTDRLARLTVSGLKGGHSGIDINLGRGNAIKIAARFLDNCSGKIPFKLVSMDGGVKRNSIPGRAEAVVALSAGDFEEFAAEAESFSSIIMNELGNAEPGFMISVTRLGPDSEKLPLTRSSAQNFLNLVLALPNGLVAMSTEVEGLVETSVNLGVLETDSSRASAVLLTRSSISSAMDAVKSQIRACSIMAGAKLEEPEGYPGWKPNMDSELLKIAADVFIKLHGKEPAIKAVHAGLECGLFSERLPGVDMISIGPDMQNVHSPDEQLSIPSVKIFFEYLEDLISEFH